jgi:RNA polymerase-binding transcription factor DksA
MAAKPKKATAKTPVKKAAASKKAASKPAKRPTVATKKAAAKSPAKKPSAAKAPVTAKSTKATKARAAAPAAKKSGAKPASAAKHPAKKSAPQAAKKAAKKDAKPAAKPAAKKLPATKAAAKPAGKVVAAKAKGKPPAPAQAAKPAKPAKPAKAVKPPKPAKPPIELRLAPSRYVEFYSDIPKKRTGSALSPGTLDKLRVLLVEERARLSGQADKLTAEAESLVKDRELGDTQFDEESGEGDTISIERERDLVVSAQHRQKIELVDAALTRMTNGGYGYCLVCGDRIPVARLEAAPEADMCVKCKSRGERRY